MNVTPSFDVIAQAGLSQAQFAELAQVSRITVNTWVTGKHSPSPTLRPTVNKILKVLAREVMAGRLPIDKTIGNRMQRKHLANIAAKLG